MINIRNIVPDGDRRILFGLQVVFICCYFQSHTKVAAIIKKGTSFSATVEKPDLLCGDKDSGLKLYFLYMFICH